MKKNTKIFVGVLAAVLLLSASVAYALSDTANEAAISGKEQVKDVVSVNDESVPLTEAIEASSRASTDAYGFSVSELSPVGIQAADAQMIARDTAIETAAKHLENMTSSVPSSVNAVLAGFSDSELVSVPETGRTMQDVPSWVVTFRDVRLDSQGGAGSLLADSVMVVDAYTGELLEVVSYGV